MDGGHPLDWLGPIEHDYPGFNDSWLDLPVFARFVSRASLQPTAIAVRDAAGALSYAALLAAARSVAVAIERSVPPGQPVGLALPVDRNYPAAMLGCLAAGRPYVPVDLSFPAQRVSHILGHAGTAQVLVSQNTRSQIEALLPPGAQCLEIETLQPAEEHWQAPGIADDFAYILYTSGTTGTPKGVFQTQRGLTHDILQYSRSIHLGPGDVLSGLYSPSVNGALRDIYGALLNGGTLGVIDLRRQGLAAAAALFREWGITIYHSMPPILRAFLRQDACRDALARARMAYLAGDQLFASDLALARQSLPASAQIYTGIGSTECATLYSQWFVPADWPTDERLLPVGRNVPDRRVELVGPDGRPVPDGEIGEITVASRYVAQGYWRNTAQTTARFITEVREPDIRRYNTGDLGRRRKDGLLEFLGRADRQVKIRGFRVEPAETEGTLRAQREVDDAAIFVRRQGAEASLIAYVVLAGGADVIELRSRLANLLPAHLCPSEIVPLEALPTLGNFKVDSEALAALDRQRQVVTETVREAAADEIPEGVLSTVKTVWGQVLGLASVGDLQDLSASGADSLKTLELHLALEQALGIRLPIAWFGPRLAPASLASKLDGISSGRRLDAPQLILFPSTPGITISSLQVAEVLAPGFDMLLLDYPPAAKTIPGSVAIAELADALLPQIRQFLDPEREAVFMGLCYGGLVAHDAAVRLARAGLQIDLLVLGDIAREPAPGFRSDNRSLPMFRRLAREGADWLDQKLTWTNSAKLVFPDKMLRFIHRVGNRLPNAVARVLMPRMVGVLTKRGIARWQPGFFKTCTSLFVTAPTCSLHPDLSQDLGWAPYCSSLHIVLIDGDHSDFFDGDHTPTFLHAMDSAMAFMRKTGLLPPEPAQRPGSAPSDR